MFHKVKPNNLCAMWVADMNKKRSWFEVNPQNINRNWRPKNRLREFIEEMKVKWEAPTKNDLEWSVKYLFDKSEKELDEIITNEKIPYWLKVLAKDVKEWKIATIQMMLERWFWKPKEEVEAKQEIVHSFKLVQ